MMKQFVNQKINNMTAQELVAIGKQYGIQMTMSEARQLIGILRQQPIDIFNAQQRKAILNNIAREVNPELAKKLEAIINRFL